MLMFEDMLKVYSGPAAIFSNLSLQFAKVLFSQVLLFLLTMFTFSCHGF